MNRTFRLLAVVAFVFVAVPVLLPGAAYAQYREFTGRIDKVSSKKLIVDNRKGDKVKFNKVDDTAVEGEGKTTWDALKKGDWVMVDWKFIDKPRKAYKVQVIPPQADKAEDM